MITKVIIAGKIDEHLMCYCNHEWEEHHHGCVMNPEYFDHPLCINGLMAEECEYNQFEGRFVPRDGEKTMCRCGNFKPRSRIVMEKVKEWQKKNDEIRRQKRG